MTQPDIGGIVLAAGASSRMGRPKALLRTPAEIPLATYQANLLETAGCSRITIVVGDAAVADTLADARVAVHAGWAHGRVSSLQAGLRALGPCRDGVVVLPVDTVGVSPHVLEQLTQPTSAEAARPVCGDLRGQVVWLSAAVMKQILSIEPDVRLDQWLTDRTLEFPVTHELGRNVNTPAEWGAARHLIHEKLV